MIPASADKKKVVSSGSGPASTAVRPGKYGLKAAPELQDEAKKKLYQEGLAKLKQLQKQYKEDLKTARQKALNTFNDYRADSDAQDWYAEQLDLQRISKAGLLSRLAKQADFTVDKNVIFYKGVPVASLLEGSDAYREDTSVKLTNRVFTRVDLDESKKQYVLMNGAYIRRMAYRAITPPERSAYVNGENLRPFILDDGGALTDETKGVHFFDDGGSKYRDGASRSDVQFLSDLSGGHNFDQFPAHEKQLLAYTQIRNGVGKVLSGRSTSKDITSNHGASFSRFGEVRIDLAQVPESNVVHHYNVAAFNADAIKNSISQVTGKKVSHNIATDVKRGNLSVIRNREILFTEIPYQAVDGFQESPARIAYEKAYYEAFPGAFISKFNQLKKRYVENNPANAGILRRNIKFYTIDFDRADWISNLPGLFTNTFTSKEGYKDAQEAAINLATQKFNELIAFIETPPPPRNYPARTGGNGSYSTKKYGR